MSWLIGFINTPKTMQNHKYNIKGKKINIVFIWGGQMIGPMNQYSNTF